MRHFERFCLEITPGAALFYPLLFFLDSSGALAVVLPGILFHEIGHLLAAAVCGIRIRSLRLEITGLCLETERAHSKKTELLCLAAGPAAGFLWSVLAGAVGGDWMGKSAAASLVLNGFNLLPGLPLDGGRILQLTAGTNGPVLVTTALCAAAFFYLAVRWRAWACLLPATLFGRELFIA